MVKVSVNEGSNQVSVSPITNSNILSVSPQNAAVAVSMTDSEALYYSSLAEQSADSASLSSDSAKQYSEIAQTCSKSLQTNWDEDDSNSQAYIQNKPNTVYTSGDGISVENNVISNTKISATWGHLDGDIDAQTDLKNALNTKTDINFSNITDTAKSVINTVATDKDLSNLSEKGLGKLRIIGEVVSLACTSNYLPEGCLPCDGAEYSFSQFPTFVSNYLTASTPLLQTCTYTDYTTQVSTYGFCNKFAVDTTNQKFKVPTRNTKRKIVKTYTNNNIYVELYNDGWCVQRGISNNISAGASLIITFATNYLTNAYNTLITANGAYTSSGEANATIVNRTVSTFTITSGGIASTPYSWQTSGYASIPNSTIDIEREFILVANGTLNSSQMDWSNWASSLASKAGIDLSNINSNGKSVVSSLIMPSSTYENTGFTDTTTTQTYNCPADGWIYSNIAKSTSGNTVTITKNSISFIVHIGNSGFGQTTWQPVSKNDVLSKMQDGTGYGLDIKFFYAKGVI